MQQTDDILRPAYRRMGSLGACLLAITIAGYAIYELILRPQAGFPSDDMAVILGGIDTLRVGHWLKFGYAVGIALLTVSLRARLHAASSASMDLAVLVGTGAVALFVASGVLGLRLLEEADWFYPANLADARATILIRVVTQSLQQAGLLLAAWLIVLSSAGGLRARVWSRAMHWFGMLVGVLLMAALVLPSPWDVAGPLLAMVYAGWLGWVLWRDGREG